MFNDFIEINPRKLGGTPVFRKTRIPVWVLLECLEERYSVDAFLDQYDIDPDLVRGFMDAYGDRFLTRAQAMPSRRSPRSNTSAR